MEGKRLSMKLTLDENMFENAFIDQEIRGADNLIDPNAENAVVTIPQGHAARYNTLQKRRAEIRKAFEQKDKDVEEYLKVALDRTPRTLSKDAIHRDAYKKARLAESLFEDAAPELEDEMPDNITEKELINDVKEPAEKLVDLIDEYRTGDRPVSEKGKEFINNVFEAIYNLLDLMGDEEEPTDMAEALNKFRRNRLKEAVTLTEAKHWSLNLKQVLDGIISPNAKIKLFTTDSEILTPDYVSVDQARLNNAQNIKVLEIIPGAEPNTLEITLNADDVYADNAPQQDSNLTEGARPKYLPDGSLNPDYSRITSPFRYLVRVTDSEWKEVFTYTAVYPNTAIQHLNRVHSQLNTAKYADAQRIEVIRYNTLEDLLADPYRYAPADKATIIYEEEKQEDGSWAVITNELNSQDHMYTSRSEKSLDADDDSIPSELIPNRRNRLYADLISCGGTDVYSRKYRALRLVWPEFIDRTFLISNGRYNNESKITRPLGSPTLIQVDAVSERKLQFVKRVCACYDCVFRIVTFPPVNRKTGKYMASKQTPFEINIRINNPSERIDKVDHPENIQPLKDWVYEEQTRNIAQTSEEPEVIDTINSETTEEV